MRGDRVSEPPPGVYVIAPTIDAARDFHAKNAEVLDELGYPPRHHTYAAPPNLYGSRHPIIYLVDESAVTSTEVRYQWERWKQEYAECRYPVWVEANR